MAENQEAAKPSPRSGFGTVTEHDGPEPSELERPSESDLRAENAAADAELIAALASEGEGGGPARGAAKPKQKARPKPVEEVEEEADEYEVSTAGEIDAETDAAPEEGEEAPEEAAEEDDGTVVEVPGLDKPISAKRIREALEHLEDFDGAYQGNLAEKAKLKAERGEIETQRERMRAAREDFEFEARRFKDDAAAFRKLEPFLEAGDYDSIKQIVETASARSGRPAKFSENPEVAAVQRENAAIRKEMADLKAARSAPAGAMTVERLNSIAKDAIVKDPSFKQVFGDDLDDTILLLNQRLSAEVTAKNITSASSPEEARAVILRNLKNMRSKRLESAQKLAGVPRKALKNTRELQPVSRTSTARVPAKPKSMEVDYAADGPDADRHFNDHLKRVLDELDASTR